MAKKKQEVKLKEPVKIRFKQLANGNQSIYLDYYTGINGGKLDTLEICFNWNRNDEQIDALREEVERFEYRSKKVAEKLEQVRLLNQEAEILQKGK